jgi:diphosphomevalonate decarboxylase
MEGVVVEGTLIEGTVAEGNLVSAPSNIALIKYMGKSSLSGNRPTNASISYTLENLRTFVKLERISGNMDLWSPLSGPDFHSFVMSGRGQKKFLDHLVWLKEMWGASDQFFHVYSANNFPADAGIASSASSFAALTMAAWKEFGNEFGRHKENLKKANRQDTVGEDTASEKQFLSKLSQRGSGSSCRSFFGPWAIWRDEGASGLELPIKNLLHFVIVPDIAPKKVSSSEAHLRVLQSPRFVGRIDRAEIRLQGLLESLQTNHWRRAYELCWDEFIDMHELFETCPEPFSYRTEESHQILSVLSALWKTREDGPLVTMDAGSSVHVLWRPDQKSLAQSLHQDFSVKYKVWGNF